MAPADAPVGTLLDAVREGDRRALGRLISEIENGSVLGQDASAALCAAARPVVVGITGPPGAGKSSLVRVLTTAIVGAGHRVAVLLVDPSSPVTGGAVLGDRIRLGGGAGSTTAYVRSLANRGHPGGLAAAVPAAIGAVGLAGHDVVLVETVGSGQSDIDVVDVVDCAVLACPPGLGDHVQALKSGIQEVVDVLVVTKADQPGSDRTYHQFVEISHRLGEEVPRPVLKTSSVTGEGIAELAEAVLAPRRRPVHRRHAAAPGTGHGLFDLTGRVAIVTGASGGLGRQFARVLHGAGATVVAGARRKDRLDDLAVELGDRLVPVQCDVTVESDCDRLVDAAVAAGGLDVLVNNAGTGDVVRAEDEPLDQFRGVVELNLVGLFAMCQRAARVMIGRGSGSIINIASALGLVASMPIRQAGYCASKGAVVNLTRELAAQWGRTGVRVNALAPGWFRSEMTDDMFDDDRGMAHIERNTPAGRAGRPGELDGALLFLAADASSYVLGQTIAVDGGWTIH